jgi:RNA polymerase sigma-70 factor, ECF subfamily
MTKGAPSGQSLLVASRDAHDATPAHPPELEELFATHSRYVWNTLRRLGVHTSDLEDLTHDVFMQIHSNLSVYDPTRPMKPWLFGFAFRVASQHWRRTQRRREAPLYPGEAVDPGALPDTRLAAEQDRQLVLAAMDGIDIERRAVFVLYEIDGEPMDEIARSLSIPANTAYSRLRVARAEFAAAVKRLRLKRGER